MEAREEVVRLECKRQKTATASARERPPFYEKYSGYSAKDWLITTGEIMKRRDAEPRKEVAATPLRWGEEGALEHWRRGLVGAVQDWAAGSLDNVVTLLVRLVLHFKVSQWRLTHRTHRLHPSSPGSPPAPLPPSPIAIRSCARA